MKRINIFKGDQFFGITEGTSEYIQQWKSENQAMGLLLPERYEMQNVMVQEAVVEMQDILDENNEPTGEQIEVEISPAVYELQQVEINPQGYSFIEEDITEEHNKKILMLDKMEKGRLARAVCDQVLDLIAGFNLDNNLSAEDITEMQQTFGNIELALRSARPTTAKALISAVIPSELVSQEMKDLCLDLLADY